MTGRIYLRPQGLIPRDRRQQDERRYSGALPLCGDGPYDFTAVEIIERRGTELFRESVTLGELWASDRRALQVEHADLLERLASPRARLRGLSLDRPRIMGIVNLTPDSFSDGGKLADADAAVAHALALATAGADILDFGGESTRPGSGATPVEVELARVIPVITRVREKTEALISVDTRKAAVMEAALHAGADLVNDVSALTYDLDALSLVAKSGAPVVLMHAKGDPKTMQADPRYDDVLTEVFDWLEARVEACLAAGIPRQKIIVDPGIGFGKSFKHNLALMAGLSLFHALGVPVLLGASRKRFLGVLTDEPDAGSRLIGSVAAALLGASQGVQILRVHDVRETAQALKVAAACAGGGLVS